MAIMKNLCLIVYIVILILFTIGYTTQPIYKNITSDDTNNYILGNYKNNLYNFLLYTSIGITISLALSVVLTYLNFKVISKFIYLLILISMLTLFIIIQITIATNNANTSRIKDASIMSPNKADESGYYLILVSTVLLIINFIVYLFMA